MGGRVRILFTPWSFVELAMSWFDFLKRFSAVPLIVLSLDGSSPSPSARRRGHRKTLSGSSVDRIDSDVNASQLSGRTKRGSSGDMQGGIDSDSSDETAVRE